MPLPISTLTLPKHSSPQKFPDQQEVSFVTIMVMLPRGAAQGSDETGSKRSVHQVSIWSMSAFSARIEVENVNIPGSVTRVDAAKYAEMKRALLRLLPRKSPGLTQSEVIDAVKPLLDDQIFPGGNTASWWFKCVQLDLKAKGVSSPANRPNRCAGFKTNRQKHV